MDLVLTKFLLHIVFWSIVGVTLGGAVLSVFPINIIYNVLGFALALTGIAGLYLYLGSMFMALMQILIYVGAICIAIVFAIMLSRPLYIRPPKRESFKIVVGIAASVIFFVALVGVIARTSWVPAPDRSADWSAVTIGHLLMTRYDLVFEVISLVLLVAIIGAIVIAGYSRRLS